MQASPVSGVIRVQTYGTFPDGDVHYLEVRCESYADYKALPSALTFDELPGVFGKSSWTSDRNVAVYRTDKPVAHEAAVGATSMSKQAPSSTLQHKGATYELVELPKPIVTYRGATYRLVQSEQLPDHVQEYLRKRSRERVMDEMLDEISHVNPHRTKDYDRSKVRMRDDEEQERLEETKVKVTELEARQPQREEPEDTHVSPEEVEEISFGEEQPLPFREETDDSYKEEKDFGPSNEDEFHVRVSGNDFSFLSSVPGMHRHPHAKSFMNKVKRGQDKDRNEVWTSEQEMVAVVNALHELAGDESVGGDLKTQAQDLVSRYTRIVAPQKPKAKMPSYKSGPRGKGTIRMFSYRGAKVKVRRRARR